MVNGALSWWSSACRAFISVGLVLSCLTLSPFVASAQPSTPTDEEQVVHDYIVERYSSDDVVHSFRTFTDEYFDCIDFYKYPDVKRAIAAGIEVPKPTSVAKIPATIESDPAAFVGQPDQDGNSRSCPSGTVAIQRITPELIKQAGGLELFKAAAQHKGIYADAANAVTKSNGNPMVDITTAVLPRVYLPPPVYVHVQANSVMSDNINGGGGVFSSPSIVGLLGSNIDHSVAQFWLASDANGTATVEAGLLWDKTLFGSNGQTPHLFVFSTTDSYVSTGCWNGISPTPHTCVNFIPSGAAYYPGAPLTPYVEYIVTASNISSGAAAGWHIYVGRGSSDFVDIGYYPAADYATNNPTFVTKSKLFYTGGEVADNNLLFEVPMGPWGGGAPAGQGGWVRNYVAYSSVGDACSGSYSSSCWSYPVPEYPDLYEGNRTTNGLPDWLNWLYFANAPRRFDAGNYDYQFSPVGDWAPSKYKGECPGAWPIMGISRYTSGTTSHAVKCASAALQKSGASHNQTSCNRRQILQLENRGYSGTGDWDPNNFKTECHMNEFVQGISQTTAGELDGILCCPVTPTTINLHTNCETVLVPDNDATHRDWDLGYYKGRCSMSSTGAFKYVVGVSTPPAWGGPPPPQGAHAILCCGP
jgi:hypothetical protein